MAKKQKTPFQELKESSKRLNKSPFELAIEQAIERAAKSSSSTKSKS